MDQLVVLVLKLDVVFVVSQVIRLQWINSLVISEIVQLEFVLDANLLLPSFFLFIIRRSWKTLQPPLFLYPCVVGIPILTAPGEI